MSGCDAFVDELWALALDGRANLMSARFHRAWLDANRARDDIDPAILNEPWPTQLKPTDKSRRGFGLIRRLALPDVPIYEQPLLVADVQQRVRDCYDPYHQTLANLIDEVHRQHGFCLHLDCHSMKSVGNAMNEDNGARRPDMVVSDLDGLSAAPQVTRCVAELLRAEGFGVNVNDPYKGEELIRRHSAPAAGRHSVQIEINRALYMDEQRFQKTAGFDVLAQQLRSFVSALSIQLPILQTP